MLRGSRASLSSAFLPGALSIVVGDMHAFAQTAVGSSEQLPTVSCPAAGAGKVVCAMAGLNPAGKTGRQGCSSYVILGFACGRLRVDSSTSFRKPSSADAPGAPPPY